MAKKLQEQQAVRPAVLIAVIAVAVAAVAFFVVNLLISHSGSSGKSGSTTSITTPPQQPLPNLNIPTDPPPPPGSGRDPFQPVAGAGATAAPVAPVAAAPAATAAPAAATAKPEFQATTTNKAYVQLVSVAADHKSAQIRDGTIVYEQAKPGQTLDRNVVLDSIDTAGRVHMHRGANKFVLAPGDKVLV